ncbi:MAG: hypothetical protein K0S26_950 [Bacteroidota bacterium]|jgi:hypothetical protein|nr:hypothetical protein [Bacteroidota bacterium]
MFTKCNILKDNYSGSSGGTGIRCQHQLKNIANNRISFLQVKASSIQHIPGRDFLSILEGGAPGHGLLQTECEDV